MPDRIRSTRYFRFALYALVVVLVNWAGLTLFARIDLTGGRAYSLSAVSREVVSTLSEPLTVNVFFTRNLPAPYNGVEQYLHDLLEEYAIYGGKHFNYRFYDVSADEGDVSAEATANQKLASTYGINPIQIQAIEKDEVKFQKAYMGLVMIHGDLIEQIPTITALDGLEYRLTTAIQKMNHKISALLRLPDKIQVRLFLSASLNAVAPYIGIKQLGSVPVEIERLVKDLNAKTYGKLAYEFVDPASAPDFEALSRTYNLLALSWPASADGKVPAGKGAVGLVVEHATRKITLPLINAVRLPIIGTQYQLIAPEDIEKMISDSVESLLEIHDGLGYVADHRTAPLAGGSPGGPGQEDLLAYSNLRGLISQSYSLKPVQLSTAAIPEGIACLLIVDPRGRFSDYDLFQIDQFLMQGKSLAVFADAFEELQMPGQPPMFKPVDTGLERLLAHYGIQIAPAYVLDLNCYRQELPSQLGGGDRPIYYAPLIKSQFIEGDLKFMQNIKGIVAVKASPLELLPERIQAQNLKAYRLLASSEQSWEMRDRVNLDPMFIRPPSNLEGMKSRPIAYLIEGEFSSFFAGKPLPVREAAEKKEGETPAEPAPRETPELPALDPAGIERQTPFTAKGKPGKLLVLGSSEMLKNVVIDESGRGVNTVFALNAIDYLNHREGVAVMRAKVQQFNPLSETSSGIKTFIKSFNIVGLPVLVCLFGFGVWFRRTARKKKLQAMFQRT
jgi:ABC-type uncharacterized transport system involved in gliding motility auxiliary subunit